MAKFKKLALLCTALMMTASVTAIASCGKSDRPDSSSQQQSSVSSSVDESSSEEVASSEEVESSEDVASSEVVESSEEVVSSEEVESSEDVASSEEVESSEDVASSEDVVSSEEVESSEDSSSEEPPVEEHFYYTNIVDGAAASLVLAGNYAETFGTVKFNAPSAGTYAIYAVTDLTSFAESEVKFGPEGATSGWDECFTRYTFTVDAAGEVTLTTYATSWEATTLNFNYFVYQLEACGEEGSSVTIENLAANVRNEVSFEIPEAGDYLIIAHKTLNWYSALDQAWADYEGSSCQVTATEAGKLTLYVEYVDYNSEDFDFSYEIVSLALPDLVVGENTVALYSGVNQTAYFTAETTGAYTFTISSEWNVNFTDNYETTLVVSAEAGEKVAIGLRYSGYNVDYSQEGPLVIGVNVTVETFEEDDPSALQLGANTFTASAAGTTVTFTAEEAGTYEISNGDYALYEDGDEYGSYSKEVTLEAGQSVSYVVKYDGITTVTVEKIIPPIVLNMGETTINVAGAGCDIYVADPVADGMYTLTWNNENVVVYVNGMPFASGSAFDYVFWSYSIYAQTADGADVEGVVFTLAAFEYPTLVLGDNVNIPVSASGTTYQFTATEPGNYSFAVTGDVTWVSLGSDNAYTYPDSLEAAGTIAIDVKAGAVIELFVQAAADTTASVTVAYNTTMNYLETSVVMNQDYTAPENLTIPSVKKGELVYYAASRMTGDYVLSWSVDYGNIIVYAGDNVGTQYSDCSVRLTRTMMDGVVYLVVYNNSEADLENVVLNFETYVYVDPNTQPQGQVIAVNTETTIDIAEWDSKIISFVAPAAGTYTLTTASSVLVDNWVYNENWQMWDRAWNNVIDSTTGGSYSFTLAEGEIINLFVMEYDMGAVSFVFTISDGNQGGETPEDPDSSEVPESSEAPESSEDPESSEEIESSEPTPEVPVLPDDTNREKVAINLTVGQMTDAGTTNEYGKVYNLKQGQWFIDNNLGTSMADFQANVLANALPESGEWIIFYLYNPTATEYTFHLAGANNTWTDSVYFIPLAAQAWTKVVISADEITMNKEATWYMYIQGGNSDGAAQEGWQMSTVYAVMEEGWVRSNVLVDAATQTLTQGCYGGAITVEKAVDELAGNVWNITIGETDQGQQALHHDAIDTSYYASVYFYVYNPLAKEARLSINGGWTDWGVATVMLAPKNWTKVELAMSIFSSDVAGKIFPIIQDPDAVSVAGEWKISSFYGLEADETAPEITIEYPIHEAGQMYVHEAGVNANENGGNGFAFYFKTTANDAAYNEDWSLEYAATSADNIKLTRNGETTSVAITGQGTIVKVSPENHYFKLVPWTVSNVLPLQDGDVFTISGVFVQKDDPTQKFNIAETTVTYNAGDVTFSTEPEMTVYTLDKLVLHNNSVQNVGGAATLNTEVHLKSADGATITDHTWSNQFKVESGEGLKVNGETKTIKSMVVPGFLYISFDALEAGDVVTFSGTIVSKVLAVKYVINECKVVWTGDHWEDYIEYTTYELGALKVHDNSSNGSGSCRADHLYTARADGEDLAVQTWDYRFSLESGDGVKLNGESISFGMCSTDAGLWFEIASVNIGDVISVSGTFYNKVLAVKYVIEESKFEWNGTIWVAYIPYYTVAEANAATDGTQVRIANATVCSVSAWSTTYNNMNATITDASGETLYVYRLATEVALGDIITLTGTMATYNEARQIAQGATAVITGHDSSYDYEEMTITEALAAADNTNVLVTGTVITINTAWSSTYNNISVTIADGSGDTLYIYRLATQVALNDIITVKGSMATYSGSRQIGEGATAEIIGTHTCSEYTEATCKAPATCIVCGTAKDDVLADHDYVNGTCSVCGNVEGATTKEIVFEFGANGSAAHVDGNDLGTSKSYTADGYTLALTSLSKVYGSAYDAKGNSCIKLGTSKVVGTFSFTVPDDVTNVIIKVAGYKSSSANISVNGGATQTISTYSANGAYTDVTVDTSSTKTVTFTTVSGGVRAMINSITYVVSSAPAEPVETPVSLNLNAVNALTVAAGTYLTSTVTLDGEYSFTWDNADVTVKVNGEAITSGYKATFAAEEVAIVIESSDNTVDATLNLEIVIIPEEISVDINLDVENNLTVGAGTYLTDSVTLDGEYTFTWTNSENANVTVKVNGVAITSGYKATYANEAVTIVIESSDNTVDVKVSLVITKTPDVVVPDEEWTKNY